MGRIHDGVDEALREWVLRQHVFFVATAPSGADGHVNVSPKGMSDTFTFLEPDSSSGDATGDRPGVNRCGYLDLTGSGAETIAHVRQNARITLMWCAFEGPPRIVRLHGRARVVRAGEPDWVLLASRFPARRGARAIIDVDIRRVADSCGYAVPRMDSAGERSRLEEWAASRSDDELDEYRTNKNSTSIDGLPAL